MRITTLPVYSRLTDDSSIPEIVRSRLPAGLALSEHQLQTYQALAGGEYDVVINTAMTGDGKSLAAQLTTLVHAEPLLMMYPTNELAFDQEIQINTTLEQWGLQGWLRPTAMNADRLDQIVASGSYRQRGSAISSLAANNDVLLTNPDIFHYLAQFFYTRRGDSPDRFFSRLMELFNLYTFDEFHVFEAPQVVSVLNALLLIRELTGNVQPKRFLFLSATPGGLLGEYLARAGFRVKSIEPAANGWYCHSSDEPDSTQWRRIIHRTDVQFWTSRVEEWIDTHLEDVLLAFFDRYGPCAKGAVIVNSVASAHRLVARLQPVFQTRGLTVLPNTGLTSADVRRASREADLLVGTSTVDVGVDFRINFLVFESRDAGTFLQRLGRLGRHSDDGHGHTFSRYEAHALLPSFVVERLFVGRGAEPAILSAESEITRETLTAAVGQAYPMPFQFKSYAREWGWVQSAHIYRRLGSPTVRETYKVTRERLQQRYKDTFGIHIGWALRRYLDYPPGLKPILEEVQSFRGGSPFTCGVVEDDVVKTYDLITLVRNGDMEWLGREEFTRIADETGASLPKSRIEQLAGWFRLRGFRDERTTVQFLLDDEVGLWDAGDIGDVCVIDRGITLDAPGVDWLNELNRHLRARKYVALLCLCQPSDLIYSLRLPPLFEIHSFAARDGRTGSIAFARQALMLQVAIKEKQFSCGGTAVFL